MSQRKPNIILINCDDLGYGDLGCYGSEVNHTPHLDRMAEEGLRFTDFYMASSICSPSRGAMMTGCYPPRIGFGDFDGRWVLFPGQGVGMGADEVTVATLLKDQGYATKIVGKWHCGDQPEFLPTRHGFDSYYGIPFSNDMGRQATDNPDLYPPLPLLRDEDVIQEQPDQTGVTERYVEESVRFMRENREQPFFLYLAHMHVHLPLYAAQTFVDASENGAYGACVEAIDWSAGAILDTLVVFTSDNGSRGDRGGSNGPLNGSKGTSWEGGFRLPCIMRWPGVVQPGSACGELATSMDFLPTFAGLAGAEAPSDRIIDGKDIGALVRGEPGAESPHECFYYYFGNALEAVRDERWKLQVGRRGEPTLELYDLVNDIGETTNVADENPDTVARLQDRLQACREDIGDSATETAGTNNRPIGRVENPKPLTEYDPDHPYIIATYDLTDRG